MKFILTILIILNLFNNLNSQALIADSEHVFFSSFEISIDTENIIEDNNGDYEREIAILPILDFTYVYNKSLEINLSYDYNLSINNGFQIPFEGSLNKLKIKYYFKNIVKKILKKVDKEGELSRSPSFDFNLNLNLEYAQSPNNDFLLNGYGFGLSWNMIDQTLVKDFSLFPMINYILYEYSYNESPSISYDLISIDMLTNITIPPKDNKEVRFGFFVNPNLSIINLKDSFFGIQLGIYYKL